MSLGFNPFFRKKRERLYHQPEKLRALVLKGREKNELLRFDPRDFYDPDQKGYSEKEVEADIERVKRRQQEIYENDQELPDELSLMAELLEIVFNQQADSSEWLGSECEVYPTSIYDDLFNGIDSIVEFFPNGYNKEHLGLAFDVTMASDHSVIAEKIERNERALVTKGLNKVKYFENSDGSYGLRLPHLIVGADMHHAEDVAKLWEGIHNPTLDLETRRKLRQRLASHPFQYVLIEVALVQLYYYTQKLRKSIERSEDSNQKHSYEEVLQKYESLQTIFEDLRFKKGYANNKDILDYINKDRMLSAIRYVLAKKEE